MSDLTELLAELVTLQKEANAALVRSATGGSPGSGPASAAVSASKGGGKSGGGALASLAKTAIKRTAVGAVLGGVAAGGALAGSAASGLVSSGGSIGAASGSAQKTLASFVAKVPILGDVTGAAAATSISKRATQSVSAIVEGAARSGGALSKEQTTALVKQAQVRETRVQDAQRQLETVSNEQFGDLRDQEGAKGQDRLAAAIEALLAYLGGKQSI